MSPVPLCAKVLVPKPRLAFQSQSKARVTLLKAEVLPRKEESRKQCQKKALLPEEAMLEFARGGNLQQLGVVGWPFPDPLQEALRFRPKKTLLFHRCRQWASLGLREKEDIWAPKLKMVPYEWKKNTDAGVLKGAERPSSSDLDIAAEQLTWGHARKSFPWEVRQTWAHGPMMTGQLSQILLLRDTPLRVLDAYRYHPMSRPACPYA